MFQQLSNRRFFLPGPRVRWCTRELKAQPLNDFFCEHPGPIAVGIRADEDHRARKPKNSPTEWEYTWPLVEASMGKRDVLALCERYGLLNECYKWRTNCSCFCCPFQRKQDWLNMLEQHPDLYALAEEWERFGQQAGANTRYCWNDGFSLETLRTADESQLSMLKEPREEACSICRW
jgi:3'-phosphoadenosine 5'-phosphosulfate sulfotransferase (PAPS reductase)/FAD synthetase